MLSSYLYINTASSPSVSHVLRTHRKRGKNSITIPLKMSCKCRVEDRLRGVIFACTHFSIVTSGLEQLSKIECILQILNFLSQPLFHSQFSWSTVLFANLGTDYWYSMGFQKEVSFSFHR